MWGSTSHLLQAAGRVSQSLTHDSKHTPPCDMHTFTLTHAATTLPTPLLSAGLPQQLGCAGAGVLSELARQVFPLQEKPSGFCQTYPQSISHPNAPGPRCLCLAKLACSPQAGGQNEADSQTMPLFILPGPGGRPQRREDRRSEDHVEVPEHLMVQQEGNPETNLV